MSPTRIYLTIKSIEEKISIKDKSIVHKTKNILRLKKGDTLFVFDGKGKEYEYVIHLIGKEHIQIRKMRITRKEAPPKSCIALAFPVLREHKMDIILQKATELGVNRFLPFTSKRSTIAQKPSAFRCRRWIKIITEAVRQSERLWLPSLEEVCNFNKIIKEEASIKLYALKGGGDFLSLLGKNKEGSILLLVGPEGGFSDEEKQALEEHGFEGVNLSANVLRSETAALFFAGLVNYFLNHK